MFDWVLNYTAIVKSFLEYVRYHTSHRFCGYNLSHKLLIRGAWYQVMLLKIAVRYVEKGHGKLGTDEWILMKDVGQEQQLN